MQVFQRDLELTFTLYQFDSTLHRHIRTTNHLERLFREFRTKSDEIGAFPHQTSCLTVFFLVIMLNMTVSLWRKLRDINEFAIADYRIGQTHTKVHISTTANSDRFIANGLINQSLLRKRLAALAMCNSSLCYP